MVADIETDIAICGAGPVGACAALALASSGFRVAVIEPRPAASNVLQAEDYDLRVLAISPRSRTILERLGAWQRIDGTRICDYQKMHIWHQNGKASVSFDAVDLARGDLGAIVEHRRLQIALHQACREHRAIDWLMPDRISRLVENSGRGVELLLDSGIDLRARLLVAADGRDSPTRTLAGMDARFSSYRQKAIVANVETALAHADTAWQRFLATGPLAFLPLANGQSSIVWSCDNEFAVQLLAMDDGEFREALGSALEYRLGEILAISERRSFDLGAHVCDRWLDNRVLLIGDAAHGVHPLAGQGVNLGFSDVELLSDLLNSPRDLSGDRFLRRYERQRKSETWFATLGLGGLKRLYGIEQPALCLARDAGMRLVENMPWLKREMMRKAIRNLT